MQKLLIYSDAFHIGGHEIQLLSAVKKLKYEYDVNFIVNKDCKAIKKKLFEMGIPFESIPNSPGRLGFITRFLNIRQIFIIMRLYIKYKPDIVLVAQGNIEKCGTGILAAKLLGLNLISYIPVTHYLSSVSKHKKIAILKDLFNFINFNLCDNYITINDFNKNLIKKRNKFARVEVVNNGIDFNKLDRDKNKEVPIDYDFFSDRKVVLIIGRIEFRHKGQDLVVECLEKYKEHFLSYDFIFCGSGEDSLALKEKVKNIKNAFVFEHVEDVAPLYLLADLVLIPSRFEAGEGSPMTLLEALYFRKKVVMSNLPGADEYVDRSNLFEVGSIDGMFKALMNSRYQDNQDNRDFLLSRHDESRMADEFREKMRTFKAGVKE